MLLMSVVFTWDLPKARALAQAQRGKRVVVGGPATMLLPGYFDGVATVCNDPGDTRPIKLHNVDACRTSQGCNRGCKFCAVKIIEGDFQELGVEDLSPVICDSNFLQSSDAHFNRVIDAAKSLPWVDSNQGLDARILTQQRAERLCELNLIAARFAWDNDADEDRIMRGIELMRTCGYPKSKLFVYCLVNFKEDPAAALHRVSTLRKLGITGFPMRYQPLDTLKRNSYVAPQWDEHELKRFCYYWSRLSWVSGIPYDDFVYPPLKGPQKKK